MEKVEEAISLKDFDDLYQRARESTNMTKTTPKVTTNVYQISKTCEDQALQMNSVLSHLSLGKSILFQPAALYLTNIVFIWIGLVDDNLVVRGWKYKWGSSWLMCPIIVSVNIDITAHAASMIKLSALIRNCTRERLYLKFKFWTIAVFGRCSSILFLCVIGPL